MPDIKKVIVIGNEEGVNSFVSEILKNFKGKVEKITEVPNLCMVYILDKDVRVVWSSGAVQKTKRVKSKGK